jgi:hypothetical protein
MTKKAKSKSIKGRLKLRRLGIDTYRENVAYLHRECGLYRVEGFQALSKVKICAGGVCLLVDGFIDMVDGIGFCFQDVFQCVLGNGMWAYYPPQ